MKIVSLAMSDTINRRFHAILAVIFVSGGVLHVLRSYLFFSIYRDEATQVAAATSLLDGFGLTIAEARSDATVVLERTPMVQFPLGYPILLSGLLAITNNIVIANLWVTVIVASVFYLGAYIILSRIEGLIGPVTSLAVAAFWAFIWSPLRQLNTAEELALSFFVVAVAFGLLTLVSRRWLLPLSVAAIAMVAVVATRYAYWPLVVVVPLALLFSQIASQQRKRTLISSLVILAAPVVVLCAIAIFNHAYGGRSTLFRTTPLPRELHLENVVRCDPFPASALGFSQALDWLAAKVPRTLRWPVRHAVAWFFAGVIVIISGTTCGGLNLFRKLLHFPNGDLLLDSVYLRFMVWCGGTTVVLTVGMLAYLSLGSPVSYPPFASEYGWLPIQERRYFASTHPFLAILFIFCLVKLVLQSGRRRWAAVLVTTVVIAPIALNSGKDWVGCLIGYKGWGNSYGKIEAQSRYSLARRLVNEGWLCISVSDQLPPERGYEFMGGAFPVHIADITKLSDVRNRSLALFFPASLEENVLARLTFLEKGKLSRFERRTIDPLGRYVAILVEKSEEVALPASQPSPAAQCNLAGRVP